MPLLLAARPSSPSQPQFQLRLSEWPITISVAIRLIVFVVVSDEIVEAKPVMRGYVVHGLIRPIHITRTIWKQVIASVQSPHQGANHAGIAFHKRAEIIAELPVPLSPRESRETPS